MLGILSIYEADVFHRDISRRNLVIFKGKNDEIGKGYIIDFDCAAFCDHTRCAVAELTVSIEDTSTSARILTKHSGNCAIHGNRRS